MIRKHPQLRAELTRVNSDLVPLVMQILAQGTTAAEQREFAERLIDLNTRLRQRADEPGMVVDGQTGTDNIGASSYTANERER